MRHSKRLLILLLTVISLSVLLSAFAARGAQIGEPGWQFGLFEETTTNPYTHDIQLILDQYQKEPVSVTEGTSYFYFSPEPILESESVDLKTYLPKEALNYVITWSSINPSIAQISTNGIVTGVAEGTTIVTAEYFYKPGFSNKYQFSIKILPVVPQKLYVNPTSAALVEGTSKTLEITIQPERYRKFVKWSSSNPSVATVDSNGLVSAKASGTAVIRAVCGTKEVSCNVTVKKTSATVGAGTQVKTVPLLSTQRGTLSANGTKSVSFTLLVPATICYHNDASTSTIVKLYNRKSDLLYDSGTALKEKTLRYTLDAGEYEIAVKNPSTTNPCDYCFHLEQTISLNPSAFVIDYDRIVMPVNAKFELPVFALGSEKVSFQDVSSPGIISVSDHSNASSGPYCEIRAHFCGEADVLITAGTDAMLFHVRVIEPTETKVFLNEISGSLKPNENESFPITLSEAAFLELSGVPGYKLITEVQDSSGNTIHEYNANTYGTQYLYLQKGTYRIVINNTSKYDSRYSGFSVKALYISEVPVSSLSLNCTAKYLEKGKTLTLKATVLPANATGKLTWESSDSKVASVKDGVVTGAFYGKATITVKKGDKTASCVITVGDVIVKKVSISGPKKLVAEHKGNYRVTCSPAPALSKPVVWTSSNPAVATINANGVLTAKKLGVTTVSAKVDNAVARKKVCVYEENAYYSCEVGKSYSFASNAKEIEGYKSAVWSVKSTKRASIDQKGTVKILKDGTNYVYATIDGNRYQWEIVAKSEPKLSVNYPKMHLFVSKQKKYNSETLEVKNANGRITFKSSNSAIATVNSKGKVTAKAPGVATITIKSGKRKCTCSVRVDKLEYGYMTGSVVTLSGYRGGYEPDYGAKIYAYDQEDCVRYYCFKQNNETNYKIKLPVGHYRIVFESGDCKDTGFFSIFKNKTTKYNARLS